MIACHGRQGHRYLTGHHRVTCTEPDWCAGCQPCTEAHCPVCRHTHHHGACPNCLAKMRGDLAAIATLWGRMDVEAAHRGVDSEAAMLAGPAADPEAWRNRAMSALAGRVDAAYLDDNRDEPHPGYVLNTWRQILDVTDLVDAFRWRTHHPDLADMARELAACRAHLEAVARDEDPTEVGAPCPHCTHLLTRDYAATPDGDRWACARCGAWWTDDDYRRHVAVEYRRYAAALPAPDIAEEYRVPAGSIRGWASKGLVRKRGQDARGRQLYDVDDVLACRDGTSSAPERGP